MSPSEVLQIFEKDIAHRVIASEGPTCNITSIHKIIEEWKSKGYTIVFTAGIFDLLTINHILALYHYRLMGGAKAKLVVSIDTDRRVRSQKAFKIIKGNTVKPILTWESRARMIAKQSFLHKTPLVDLIIQHGDDTCSGNQCPHNDNVDIAEYIEPDIIAVTSTSIETIKQIAIRPAISNNLVVIKENDILF